jgi:hypothetical protein
MRLQVTLDWIAFAFLLIGAFAWRYFVTGVNIPDALLERMWDLLDEATFIVIALSGLYSLYRVSGPQRVREPRTRVRPEKRR